MGAWDICKPQLSSREKHIGPGFVPNRIKKIDNGMYSQQMQSSNPPLMPRQISVSGEAGQSCAGDLTALPDLKELRTSPSGDEGTCRFPCSTA